MSSGEAGRASMTCPVTDMCLCGTRIASIAHAGQHQAEAVAAAGLAVVQLPEPENIQGEKRWRDGDVWTGGPDRVRAYLDDARMTSAGARELAAALLAAAATAETVPA